jgi:carbon-monoxide dehydrogenase large subunit
MGPYRGVGRPISTFVMERLLDMTARRISLDPAELRHQNLIRSDEFPYRAASGIVWDGSGFVESLTRACITIDYPQLRAEQAAARVGGRLVGIGIASYAELTGIGSRISAAPGMLINTSTEAATIRLDATGAVTGSFGIASHGQGLETTLARVIAEELGARLEDIQILQGDSAVVAHGTGTYASRSAVLAGGAATLAARLLKDRVIRAASHLLEASVEDIDAGRVGLCHRHGPFPDLPGAGESRLFRNGPPAETSARGARGHQDLRPLFRHDDLGNTHRSTGDRPGDR